MSMITDSGDEYEYQQVLNTFEYRSGLSMSIALRDEYEYLELELSNSVLVLHILPLIINIVFGSNSALVLYILPLKCQRRILYWFCAYCHWNVIVFGRILYWFCAYSLELY